MNNSRKTLALAQVLYREFSKTATRNAESVSPRFQKLKEVQKKFGLEDNTPVYIKGGITDKFLYSLTCVVTLAGIGLSLETFYRLINK